MSVIKLLIPQHYYIKDPGSTDLGQKIVSEGIKLLDELGFENFTFKKLGSRIGSTEASVYRYFENKLKFLLYLSTLYWKWIEYLIDYRTHFIEDPKQKLKEILKIITHKKHLVGLNENLDLDVILLKKVVMTESDKTYLTKQVDEINKEGLFRGYKDLCHKIAEVINDINPDYEYPNALVSTIMEASNQQVFFAHHLPSLTEIKCDGETVETQLNEFLNKTTFKLLQ